MKDTTLSIRISTDDLKKIRVNAERAKLSQSEYVIRCCLGKRVVVMDGLKDVLTELRRIGNNINQLTVLANMGKLNAVDLGGITKSLAEIGRTLRDLQEGR